jgi:hypothetical protein
MERYITDSLDDYNVGACPACGSTIGHADLHRAFDEAWKSNGHADGKLVCASCGHKRNVIADVSTGSVRPVFHSMKLAYSWTEVETSVTCPECHGVNSHRHECNGAREERQRLASRDDDESDDRNYITELYEGATR